MSELKWAYDPMVCEEGCSGECDRCEIAEKRIRGREFIKLKSDLLARLNLCYVDKYSGEVHMYDKTLDAVIDFFNFFTEVRK